MPEIEKFKNQVEKDFAVGFYDSGIDHADKGNFVQSIADFTKVIALNPSVPEAYYNRGIAYNKIGNLTQAIADFTKVVELNPDDPRAYCFRGSAYGEQGNLTRAMADFTKAIDLSPNDPVAYHNRAVVLYQFKEYDKAWDDVRKVQKIGATVNPEIIRMLKEATGE